MFRCSLGTAGFDWIGLGELEQLLTVTFAVFAARVEWGSRGAAAEQYREVCAWGRFVPVRWLRNVLIEQKNSPALAVIWLILVAELLLSVMRD